jgi:hypothetical protein
MGDAGEEVPLPVDDVRDLAPDGRHDDGPRLVERGSVQVTDAEEVVGDHRWRS